MGGSNDVDKTGPASAAAERAGQGGSRILALDAARAFALLLGVLYHAAESFCEDYAFAYVQDVSTGQLASWFMLVSHSFRLELFFLLAGFFAFVVVRRKGTWEFARTRLVRLGIPFVAGWFLIHPPLAAALGLGAGSMRGDLNVTADLQEGFWRAFTEPRTIYRRSHLWFLYYLLLITAMVLAARTMLRRHPGLADRVMSTGDAWFGRLLRASGSLPVLVVATMTILLTMRHWGVDTPNQSLRPYLPALALYGGFFAFGWMVGRQPAVLEPFTRVSPALVGAAAAGITGSLLLIRLKPVGDAEAHAWTRVAFTGCYAVMMWSLLRLTIGFFLRVFPSATHDSPCRHTHPWVHYLADSSYAIYLAHFPLVIALQALVAAIPVHWGIKLVFIFGITMAVLLPIYDVLVRPTLIGKILNGRRKPSVLVSAWTMRIEPEGERDSVGMASASGTDVDVETVPGLPPK